MSDNKHDPNPPMRGDGPFNHVTVSLSLPRDLLRTINVEARARGQTRSAYVAVLLATHQKRRPARQGGEQQAGA
jgi:metal-responsive CopG/Arc/MetJ family transcriptional regulator